MLGVGISGVGVHCFVSCFVRIDFYKTHKLVRVHSTEPTNFMIFVEQHHTSFPSSLLV